MGISMMLYKAISLLLVTGFCSASFFQKQEDRVVQNTNSQEDDILRMSSSDALRSRNTDQRSSGLEKKDENCATQEELAAVTALLDIFIHDTAADMEKLRSASGNHEAAIAKLQDVPLHFYVYHHTKIEPAPNEVLRMTQEMSNLHRGYDTRSGKFTCPVSGLYYFNYHVFGQFIAKIDWGGTFNVGAYLIKDNKQINKGSSQVYMPGKEGQDWTNMNGDNSAILLCNKGEQLWLASPSYMNKGSNRIDRMNFSGYLIRETP